jgi:subtilisin family serine protease
MLTDEEAEALRSDPRVRAVEIPPDQRDDISIGLNASQSGTFFRGSGLDNNYVNWGLRRCMAEANNFVSGGSRSDTIEGGYEYAMDGTGVDVVIQDSGIDPDHPDWNDYNGTSRLQQIDWYTESGVVGTQSQDHYRDLDGHGSHCASIAAGLLYGWAKGAQIYSQKLGGLETLQGSDGTGIPIADAFDCIRLWHTAKTNGRPTVVNMSWGYGANVTGDPTSGTYRGTAWTYGVDYTNRAQLMAATGVSQNFFGGGTSHRIPVRVASVDAEVDDMILDGIHVCIAAGNNLHKADLPAGADYDNTSTFGGTSRTYHRGSSPYSLDAFMVGNIDSGAQTSGGATDNSILLDQTSSSTTRGPGVNIFAPGTDIMAATSTGYDTGSYSVTGYPGTPGFPIMSISGTSMASPQVCGVVAQHLQVFPNLTPAQMQTRIFNDSKSVLFTTNSDTDYERIYDSLMGAPNRMLYSRYGKQAITVNTVDLLEAISVT